MTALLPHLLARIAAEGPLPMSVYMGECLLHPVHGYYTTRDPFGAAGDFTTAPEISQMFGEMLGLCLAQAWMDQGAPAAPILAELGPGRGTLMADVCRTLRAVPGFAPEIHLVEASPTLRARQGETLGTYAPTWHDTIAGLPEGRPLFLLANEFFDALPVRQYQRSTAGWDEVVVGASEGALSLARVPVGQPSVLASRRDVPAGGIVEVCPAAGPITAEVAVRINADGGAALILDYGDWRSAGDTVQALRAHQPEGILAAPGQADLTAHVDFEALALHGAPARVSAMTPQGVLLERLGITARAQTLAKALEGAALESHIAAHRRLTHPEEMGLLFKALALVPQGAPLPPGFD